MAFGRTTPILRIFDEAKARETTELDAFHRELTGKGYKYARPGIEEQPWGREVSIRDPFGNRLTFAGS